MISQVSCANMSLEIVYHRRLLHAFFLIIPTVMTGYIYLFSNISQRVVTKTTILASLRPPDIVNSTHKTVDVFKQNITTLRTLNTNHSGFQNDIFYIKTPTFALNVSHKMVNASCSDFFQNKGWIIKEDDLFIEDMEIDSKGPLHYMNITKECYNFTRDRRYIMDALTTEERDFPLAYSILMYKDIEQFERLLRAIYRPQNCYCIHVDLHASTGLFNAVESIAKCFPNVFVSQKRYLVKWGTYSVLEPELKCMEILHRQNKLWKYFINLTGQEFPLKTNYELVKILQTYNGTNDIEMKEARMHNRWRRVTKPPHGIMPIKGAVHIVASRPYVHYLLTEPISRDLLQWVRWTKIPDETFFATLNHNPQLGVPGTGFPRTSINKPYIARYKKWRLGRNRESCAGHYLRGICIFGIGDLPMLAKRKELFANKFIWTHPVSHMTFECMEEFLRNKTWEHYFSGRTDLNISWYATFSDKKVVHETELS